ncbi:MAG: hypothetical protein BIFFINMI_03730 [Phycisphaerae bacterium]|nr:hypothetical protein [Phycisphaerae bacterium]
MTPTRPPLERRLRRTTVALMLALAATPLAGCKKEPPASVVTVTRGHLEPGESVTQWKMQTDRAIYAEEPGNWTSLVLAYQLPGSRTDNRFPVYAYYLYIHMQSGPGVHAMSGGGRQQAYLLLVGRRKGEVKQLRLSRSGMITADPIVPGDAVLKGTFDLSYTDGAQSSGRFAATLDAQGVKDFEDLYLPALAKE